MTNIKLWRGALCLILATGIACSDGPPNQFALDGASIASDAAGEAWQKITESLKAADGGWVKGTKNSFTVGGRLTNFGQGYADVTGTGAATSSGYSMKLKMRFNEWRNAIMTYASGELYFDYAIVTFDPKDYVLTITGDMDMRGITYEAYGSFNYTITYRPGQSRKTCGSIGGHDLNDPGC